jgi:hypothetical protein
MRTISAKDRQRAVHSFGLQLAASGRQDAAQFLGEILSEASATRSTLLIHRVLQVMDDQGWQAWDLFAAAVSRTAAARTAAEHR